MERTYYENDEYRCPRCGGLMIPSGADNEWECCDCDLTGIETWLGDNQGYVEVDIEEYEELMEQMEEDEREWFEEEMLRHKNG
jgi:tRNA(Ile2) C34 agmatinyltransferase TiaS